MPVSAPFSLRARTAEWPPPTCQSRCRPQHFCQEAMSRTCGQNVGDGLRGGSAGAFEVVDDHASDPADPIFFLLVAATEIVREHSDDDWA